MAFTVRAAEYYHLTVHDEPGIAYRILSQLADRNVDLLAFTAVPSGTGTAQLTLFPKDPAQLRAEARASGLELEGPHRALLVQGDDQLGSLAAVHEPLFKAGVNVYASSGVTDGKGAYGYVIWVRADQFDLAAQALSL